MLVELNIKNFAIIDDLKITFNEGLNLLTGETGSGKSIIIDALGILLGGRSNKNLIRQGKDGAYLEALFFVDDSINPYLKELGYFDDDNILIISREISKNQPSLSRVNGRPVTLSVLNGISSKLVDIYGQFEHQSLLDISNHMKIIDSFGNSEYHNLLTMIYKNYNQYKDEVKKLEEVDIDPRERQRQMDLLKFQMNEIDEVDLYNIDEDKLVREYKKLDNAKNIIATLLETLELLNGYSNENSSILDMLNIISSHLNNYSEFDESIKSFKDRVNSSLHEIEDLWNEIRHFNENLYIDEERLTVINEQIDHINRLKRKYGNNISDILIYRDDMEDKYNSLLNFEEEINNKKIKIKRHKKQLLESSLELSKIRKKISRELENRITKELQELNMEDVKFKVRFEEKDTSFNGIDNIEFLISTNQGEDLKPLSKIVSGGEMSRIMLAFKSITASKESIPTLIFDEIDTGISGRTAQIVGEKINRLGENHQIIIISHLPQIAALADHYYLITKSIIDKKTRTKVKKLSENDRILELARLLGGSNLTETTLKNAKEMLEMSKELKEKISSK